MATYLGCLKWVVLTLPSSAIFFYNFITFDWSFTFSISLFISVCAAFSSLLTSFVFLYSFFKNAHEFITGRQCHHMLRCLCGMKNRCASTNHQQTFEEVVWLVIDYNECFLCVVISKTDFFPLVHFSTCVLLLVWDLYILFLDS